MIYFFLFYLFLLPLEYIQEKAPKGPTGMNYQTLSLFFLLLWLLISERRKTSKGAPAPPVTSPLSLPLVLLLVWNYFCRFYAGTQYASIDSVLDPTSVSFSQFLQYLNGFLLFWIVLKLFHNRERLDWLLLALIMSAPMVFRAFRSDFHGGGGGFSNELRGHGPFVNVGSNELAAYFLYNGLFFLIYYLGTRQRQPRTEAPLRPLGEQLPKIPLNLQRLLYLVPGGLYAYGVLYSYSRGTWIAYLIGMGLVGVLRHRLILAIMIVAALLSPFWLPKSVIDRYNMTEDEEGQLESSAQSRPVFWATAIKMWHDSPIIGNGIGSFKARVGMDTHGVYHRTLAEQGAVGFAIFMWVWATILFISARLWLKAPTPENRQYGFALLVATVTLMVANIFGDRITHLPMIGQYWVLVGIGGRLYANMVGVAALDDEPTTQTESAPGQETQQGMILIHPAAAAQTFDRATTAFIPKPATDLNVVGGSHPDMNLPRPEKTGN